MLSARDLLLAGLVDYAGLFPPATLALGPALDRYAADRAGADAWLLGRFVIPVGALPDVPAARLDGDLPWRFSVLGHPPEDGEAWLDAARRTLADARAFEAALGARAAVDRFEIRLPDALAADPDALAGALAALERDLVGADDPRDAPRVALEVPVNADAVAPAAEGVARAVREAGRPAFALKLRCGGVTPDAIPPVEALAGALAAAVRAGAAVKATAGLHHPLRGMADVGGAPMHGFVNVFGGAALAARHGLGADDLAEILDDGRPASWRLADDLAWRVLAADGADVARARAGVALSFGSCSFDEPTDDLRALGWLDGGGVR